MPEKIILGGRAYRIIGLGTLQHTDHVIGVLSRAGLLDLVVAEGEDPEVFWQRVLMQVFERGEGIKLLASLLIPFEMRDAEWSPSTAAATEQHVSRLTAPQDVLRANQIRIEGLLSFFRDGRIPLRRSQKPSTVTAPGNGSLQQMASSAGGAA